jgi:hypothetical protein
MAMVDTLAPLAAPYALMLSAEERDAVAMRHPAEPCMPATQVNPMAVGTTTTVHACQCHGL